MRPDTKQLCELLDQAADLAEQKKFKACQQLLVKIEKLLAHWVERHLSP